MSKEIEEELALAKSLEKETESSASLNKELKNRIFFSLKEDCLNEFKNNPSRDQIDELNMIWQNIQTNLEELDKDFADKIYDILTADSNENFKSYKEYFKDINA